ncbi:MAG: 2-oxoglutarate oxidoreductase subunit KorA [Lentisphaerae bacterium ADurb.Bin242]|nr:MAG: 2-oxoglutarate oxidoreductase subunit KorA [Lentisphaerae bacterium ADurb.Bin242]
MDSTMLQVVIGGEAGQGLVTLGELLARCLVRSGYHIHVTQRYMSRIRGGHNTFSIRFGVEPADAPAEAIHVLVALDADTVHLHREEMVPDGGMIIIDESLSIGEVPCVRVPFKNLSEPRYENVVALGVAAALFKLDKSIVKEAVAAYFGNKDASVSEANQAAIDSAYTWAETSNAPALTPAPANAADGVRLMMNGNEALALGALAGGVKFCAFYPMSPATSILLNLAKHAEEMGLIVEQAEDEIAALNMAIGASFSGSRSMTATSGGGFALMTEGVSLAGMTEVPVVIVVAQRPGPATGLPTRTEQADLEFVLHAGHGEFPRAIFAPGSIEECFELMSRTFALAEASQGPVFLLTDQFLADSYRDVLPFKLNNVAVPQAPPQEEAAGYYQRYAITGSGVSPRRIPGAGPELVVADSDEHDEAGHITEDLALRAKMVEKRLRKSKILIDNIVPPEYSGEDAPELLLLNWGSLKGAVKEAANRMRAGGKSIGTLHFSQVWPLAPVQFLERLQGARRVVCVEGNASGQFSRLIRRETGFVVHRLISRYDGLPITPDYIMEELHHE